MSQGLIGRRRETWRRAIAWIFLSMCGLGVVGAALYLVFTFAVGPREDPLGRCAFSAPPHLNPDQVRVNWSENLLTNTLSCTWSSVDGTESTTVKINAY